MTCEVCGTRDNVKRIPVMTREPFNATPDQQRYVCGDCFYCWFEYGATSAEDIRKLRSDESKRASDAMLKALEIGVNNE